MQTATMMRCRLGSALDKRIRSYRVGQKLILRLRRSRFKSHGMLRMRPLYFLQKHHVGGKRKVGRAARESSGVD